MQRGRPPAPVRARIANARAAGSAAESIVAKRTVASQVYKQLTRQSDQAARFCATVIDEASGGTCHAKKQLATNVVVAMVTAQVGTDATATAAVTDGKKVMEPSARN